jgi:hypothetical protein
MPQLARKSLLLVFWETESLNLDFNLIPQSEIHIQQFPYSPFSISMKIFP